MPGRAFVSATGYRYGFNGMEKDDEAKGLGNSYTTLERQYDPRLGRWFSIDKQTFHKPFITPYNSMSNNPIINIDPFGDDDYYNEKGKFLYHTDTKTDDARFITQKSFNAMKNTALKTKYGETPTVAQTALFKFKPELKTIEAKSVKIQIQTPEDQEKAINALEEQTAKDKKESGGFVVFDIKDPKNPKLFIVEDKTATRSESGIILNGSEHYDDDPNTNYVKGTNKTQVVVGDLHSHPQGDDTHGPSTPGNTSNSDGENDQDLSMTRNHAMFVADKSVFSVIKGVIKDLGRKSDVARESLKDYGKRKN